MRRLIAPAVGVLLLGSGVQVSRCQSLAESESQAHLPTDRLVIITSGLRLEDLNSPSYGLGRIGVEGTVGLMHVALRGKPTELSAILSMCLGRPAEGLPSDEQCFGATELVENVPAKQLYQTRMGPAASIQGAAEDEVLLHLGIASLNQRGIMGGWVGDIAAKSGKSGGLGSLGASGVAGLLVVDNRGIGSCWKARNVMIARFPGVPERDPQRSAAITTLDSLVSSALSNPRYRSVLLVSALPYYSGGVRPLPLAPLVLWERGKSAGLIESRTTRTRGIISSLDIAPTILSWIEASNGPAMHGTAVQSRRDTDPLRILRNLNRSIERNRRAMVPVFGFLAVVLLGVLWLSLAGPSGSILRKAASAAALFLLSFPAGLLVAAGIDLWLGPLGDAAYWALVFYAVAGVALVCSVTRRRAVSAICLLTLGLAAVDTILGQPLQKMGLLSSGLLDGLRFYGIGNEMMGVLAGMALAACTLSRPSFVQAALMAGLVALLGLPWLGADAGGAVTAVVGLAGVWFINRRKMMTCGHAVVAAACGILVAVGMGALDRVISGTQGASHLGQTVSTAQTLGLGPIAAMVGAKLAMNARILLSLGSIAGFAALAWVVARLRRGPNSVHERLVAEYPGWAFGVRAAAWTGLTAMLFNDSGAIAALFVAGPFVVAAIVLSPAERPDPWTAAR